MQWQRVLHGFSTALENVGRVHSVYEFTLREIPGQLVRIRVVETPEGQYLGLPDHFVQSGEQSRPPSVAPEAAISAEKALQDAVRSLVEQVKPPYDHLRLVRLQNW